MILLKNHKMIINIMTIKNKNQIENLIPIKVNIFILKYIY